MINCWQRTNFSDFPDFLLSQTGHNWKDEKSALGTHTRHAGIAYEYGCNWALHNSISSNHVMFGKPVNKPTGNFPEPHFSGKQRNEPYVGEAAR